MRCDWQAFLGILPAEIRRQLDKTAELSLQELRLRLGQPPLLILGERTARLSGLVTQQDIQFVINTASRYSPWTAESAANGFLTAPGGHRIGICGQVVIRGGEPVGIKDATALCIRVARDFPGIGKGLLPLSCNLLILGPPGSGKTTLLRDLVRQLAEKECVSVVDERCELFPAGVDRGAGIDVLSGCSKPQGLSMLLRSMGPQWIAVDEITAKSDCDALSEAQWCGVRLLATAHAHSMADLLSSPVYQPIVAGGLFRDAVILSRDKRFRRERIPVCR